MKVTGNYEHDGYAHIKRLVPPEVAAAFIDRLQTDLEQSGVQLQTYARQSPLLKHRSVEIYGYHYKPMITSLWGLTRTMTELSGRDLLPTYNYFRSYRQGDVCRVYSDCASCKHILSLTLAYSDRENVGFRSLHRPAGNTSPNGGRLRQGFLNRHQHTDGRCGPLPRVTHRHGRVKPNPTVGHRTGFHHWVDRHGPNTECAFDREARPGWPSVVHHFALN